MVFVKNNNVSFAMTRGVEPLLEAIGKVAPENPRHFKLMGDLRRIQKRPAEAFDFYWRSLPGLSLSGC